MPPVKNSKLIASSDSLGRRSFPSCQGATTENRAEQRAARDQCHQIDHHYRDLDCHEVVLHGGKGDKKDFSRTRRRRSEWRL
jgi:hypothetical protein